MNALNRLSLLEARVAALERGRSRQDFLEGIILASLTVAEQPSHGNHSTENMKCRILEALSKLRQECG